MTAHSKIPTRLFGAFGPKLPRVGCGLMNNSGVYNLPPSDADRLAFLDHAYSQGQIFWDTADEYGDSEDLLGKWFAANPEKRKDIFLATKFGIRIVDGKLNPSSSPEYCRQSIDRSLKRLGLPYVDIYYIHRLDKVTPIEKTIQTMVELKNEGKIKHLGISECSADSLRRAHAVHPITAIQVEYSLFCREIESPETKLLETARELGVAVVCYSPLGNGFLTGRYRTIEDVSGPGDRRKIMPWYRPENLGNNLVVLDKIIEVANAKGISTAQLALAWLLAQGDDIFPIPGTINTNRLDENLASALVEITAEEKKLLRKLASEIIGDRFQNRTGFAYGDTPLLE